MLLYTHLDCCTFCVEKYIFFKYIFFKDIPKSVPNVYVRIRE